MGYKLPDGRYVDDSGKVYKNYNDALAEFRTRQARQQQESFLKRSLNRYSTANEELYGQQQLKNTLGWIPGFGQVLDKRMQGLAQTKEDAQAGIIGHSGQLGIYQERMGELLPTKPFEIRGSDIGGDGRGEQYRQQLSQYTPKAFPMTSEGQFTRYFGTSEMDPFFGPSSRGAGAPKTAEEMTTLATQQKAPMETPLSTYYRSQSAAGRAEMPAITEGLGYAKGTPLAQWAEANPMLAKRLFEKTKAKKAAGTEEDSYAHPRDLGAGAQAEEGYTLAAYGIK